MPLTDTQIRNTKATDKTQKLFDGGGLFLEVTPKGSKRWRLKYRIEGKEKLLSLGVYPETGLKEAREGREKAKELIRQGIDPSDERKAEKQRKQVATDNCFQSIALSWWNHWKGEKTSTHAAQVWRRLEADIFPAIGNKPITELNSSDFMRVVKEIQARGVIESAHRALQTCGAIMRFAVAHELTDRNPVADVKPSDILKPRKRRNYARLDAKDFPELLRKMDSYLGSPYTRLAMQLMALTFVRTKELIQAKWEEIDWEKQRWDIPAERMKMRTPHIVPLSRQALAVLEELKALSGHIELMFPSERTTLKSMSNNTILGALKRMGYQGEMTGHGFRGVASTLLHEMGFPHDHIELQLAHQERNAVSAAYNHATYLEPRRKMMQAWADHLDKLKAGAEVIPFQQAI